MLLPQVVVMMSTYNGEKYLEMQIGSILKQQDVDLTLIIRDDGSKDGTKRIIEEYAGRDPRVRYAFNENLGAALSFIELLFTAPEADYYAFSDQDDYWQPDKLAHGIRRIGDATGPTLFHSYAFMVDKDLRPLMAQAEGNLIHSWKGALVSSATGCTIVFNQALMAVLREYRPRFVSMHDAWVYRVAYVTGAKIVYDQDSGILYRQHRNNVTGGRNTIRQKLERAFISNSCLRSNMAKELMKGYGDKMSADCRAGVRALADYRSSARELFYLFFRSGIEGKKLTTTLQLKLLILLGRL